MGDRDPQPPSAITEKRKGKLKSRNQLDAENETRTSRDHSFTRRKLIHAFLEQHADDCELRKRYAKILINILIAQVIVINLMVLVMGFGKNFGIDLDPWTARAFVVTAFLEICTFVGIVARYLFTPSAEKILDVIDQFRDMRRADHRRRLASLSDRPATGDSA